MKISKKLAATLISMILVATSYTCSIHATNNSKTTGSVIPADVNKIFQRSCNACHSAGGNPMAMAHVNFSAWDTYKAKAQFNKAADICKMVSKKAMPPASFTSSNPGTALNQEEIDLICKWSASLPAK